MKKAYIVPGYAATSKDHWFRSISEALSQKGFETSIIEFPSPNEPSLHAWLDHLRKHLRDLDGKSIIIAHSLGCVATLRFLLTLQPHVSIEKLILVSPFYRKSAESSTA